MDTNRMKHVYASSIAQHLTSQTNYTKHPIYLHIHVVYVCLTENLSSTSQTICTK